MASVFEKESPVLNFGPRAYMKPHKKAYVLWPAYAYKVVAPEIKQRQLNVLQKAVLGMCQRGVTIYREIGDYLNIHTDLVAFIAQELQGKGFLDTNNVLTQRGISVLEEEKMESYNMVVGYVFQDPWTGQCWPRFYQQLKYVDLEFKTEGAFPMLKMGTTGKPRLEHAQMVFPNQKAVVASPTDKDILKATRRHRRDLPKIGTFSQWEPEMDENDEDELEQEAIYLDRISLLESVAQAVFLTTYLYIEKSDFSYDWYVCNPFGSGESPLLRQKIEQLMRESKPLADFVNHFKGEQFDKMLEQNQELRKILRKEAQEKVEQRLTLNVHKYQFSKDLIDMEMAFLQTDSQKTYCSTDLYRQAMNAARRILETLFQKIISEHKDKQLWQKIHSSVGKKGSELGYKPHNLYQDAATKAIGFEAPIPKRFVNITLGKIKSAIEYHNAHNLTPMVTTAILAAQYDSTHPLRKAAQQAPKLLLDIETIISAGGEASHASHGNKQFLWDDLKAHLDIVYRVISILLGIKLFDTQTMDKK